MNVRRTGMPLKQIAKCEACRLHRCQAPLLDCFKPADVIWVGLSAKRIDGSASSIPLAPETPTGNIIQEIESDLADVSFYKTNLVKCPPLDRNGRLRYPDKAEMEVCFKNLEYEIETIRPSVVVLLGLQVASFFLLRVLNYRPALPKNFRYRHQQVGNASVVPVHHPSFINVYRKKQQTAYLSSISRLLRSLIQQPESMLG